MIGSGGINSASALSQKNYADANYVGEATAADQTGLMRIADQIAHATHRADEIALGLNRLSVGIHGPRPEPVAGAAESKQGVDSFAARVSHLMDAIDRLQRSYESIVR